MTPYKMYHTELKEVVIVRGVGANASLKRCELLDGTFVDLYEDLLLNPDDVHCCQHCGSTEIQYPVWQDPNTDETGELVPNIEGICRACDKMIDPHKTITLTTHLKQQNEKRLN